MAFLEEGFSIDHKLKTSTKSPLFRQSLTIVEQYVKDIFIEIEVK